MGIVACKAPSVWFTGKQHQWRTKDFKWPDWQMLVCLYSFFIYFFFTFYDFLIFTRKVLGSLFSFNYYIAFCNMNMQELVNLVNNWRFFLRKKVTVKSIRDLEDSFSDKSLWLRINSPCLLPEMYVFSLVRKSGVICAVTPDKVFTRHLNMECF